MHSYSIDKKIRTSFSIALFVVSIAVSMLLRMALSTNTEAISAQLSAMKLDTVMEFLSSTGVLPNIFEATVIYSILSFLFEKWIWKFPGIRCMHGIPNINGHWEGELRSSYSEESIPMKLDVIQTWSEISFRSTFPKSTSSSNTAAIHMEDNRGVSIYFGFHNNSTDIETGMQSYDGYNILTMVDKNTLSARYFNNRPNPKKSIKGGNMGTFSLHRIVSSES